MAGHLAGYYPTPGSVLIIAAISWRPDNDYDRVSKIRVGAGVYLVDDCLLISSVASRRQLVYLLIAGYLRFEMWEKKGTTVGARLRCSRLELSARSHHHHHHHHIHLFRSCQRHLIQNSRPCFICVVFFVRIKCDFKVEDKRTANE